MILLCRHYLARKRILKLTSKTPIERESNAERAQQLKDLIMPFILRRTKAQVAQELPLKTELIKEFEFEPKTKRNVPQYYSSIRKKTN